MGSGGNRDLLPGEEWAQGLTGKGLRLKGPWPTVSTLYSTFT